MFHKLIGPSNQVAVPPDGSSALARFEFGRLRQETLNRFVLDYRVKPPV
jgi:hypothetical protein